MHCKELVKNRFIQNMKHVYHITYIVKLLTYNLFPSISIILYQVCLNDLIQIHYDHTISILTLFLLACPHGIV